MSRLRDEHPVFRKTVCFMRFFSSDGGGVYYYYHIVTR